MGPVFPFDVSIIVFLIFSGAGELDGFFTFEEVIVEETVEEFTAVIEIDAADGKRQGIFHIFDFPRNFAKTLAVGGTLFSPARGNVDGIGGKGVVAFDGGAAVSDGICFKEPGLEFIPLPCFDGDVVFEQESGFGGALSFAAVETLYGFEKAVDGRR